MPAACTPTLWPGPARWCRPATSWPPPAARKSPPICPYRITKSGYTPAFCLWKRRWRNAGRPAFRNLETLRRYAIRSMVTKDGGTAGGFPEKLEAARLCGVQVILVRRPHDAGLDPAQLLKRLEELA